MNKEEAIGIIDKVSKTDYNDFAKEEIAIVKRYCQLMNVFDYNQLISYINFRKPTPMGGKYIDWSRAIDYLKQELRKAKQHERTLNSKS